MTEEEFLFSKALNLSLEQLDQMQNSSSSIDSEIISLIFIAQYYMLKDKSLTNKIIQLIRNGESAPDAVRIVINEYA
jgi:phosphotransferase system, enzyme I, PtsP